MNTISETRTAEHYHSLFNAIDEGFCIVEVLFDINNKPKDCNLLEVNPAFEKQTGLINVQGKTIRQMIPLLEDYWLETIGRVALTGEPVRFQNRAKQLKRYYNIYAYRFGLQEDRQVAVLFSDISVQKKAEEELLRKEAQYQSTLDNLLEGCAILSYNWTYLYLNENNARHAHSTREEMIGRKMTELIPGVENSEFFLAYKRCMDERKYQHVEGSFKFNDGSVEWFDVFIHPVPEGIFVLSMDITARKSAEMELHKALRELRDSEAKLRVLQLIAKMGIGEWDLENNSMSWSDELYVIFERDSSTGPPPVDEALEYLHPDDKERVYRELDEVGADGNRIEYRLILPGNKTRYIACYVKAIFNQDGKQIRRICAMQDITESKLMEFKLKHTLEQLEEKIQEKEILLRELYHRTKNNMQIISSLLNLRGSRISDEVQRSAFLEMKNRIQAMSLVHERLYRTRSLSKLNLASYIKELVDLLIESHIDEKNNIIVSYDLDDTEVAIDTAIPCGLIVTELILNVIKYAFPADGKGNLSIKLSISDDGLIKLKITDDGIGIPDAGLNIEEKLGIQIVKGLVEDQLKGEINLLISKGTCWTIIFKV